MNQQEFLNQFKASMAFSLALNEKGCHLGTLTIKSSVEMFGLDFIGNWVDSLIQDFIQFGMIRCSWSLSMRKDTALAIIVKHQYMLCTELLLFFFKAKAGEFGKFLGQLEPLDITTRLISWGDACKVLRNEMAAEAHREYLEAIRQGSVDYHKDFDLAIVQYGESGQLEFKF